MEIGIKYPEMEIKNTDPAIPDVLVEILLELADDIDHKNNQDVEKPIDNFTQAKFKTDESI
jgi:hypothetical protein